MTNNTNTLTESQFTELNQITNEYNKAMLLSKEIKCKTVVFYGGAMLGEDTQTYSDIQNLAQEFGKEGWGVITGGGPGVMTAGLSGAKLGGGEAIGFRINIRDEKPNIIGDIDYMFEHFTPRKYALRSGDVYVYCPGSVGTLDELMENLDLMKTGKMPIKPIYLYNSSYWSGLQDWIAKKNLK
jgi:uncharacterized protein (TIGR00730 family)